MLDKNEADDLVGHGAAVAYIIDELVTDAEIFSFCISDTLDGIEEADLLEILLIIQKEFPLDFLNISMGCTQISTYHKMRSVCSELSKKSIIVAAFDNDGAISFPAAFEEVIGVDVADKYMKREEIILVENSLVNVVVSNRYYSVRYKGKRIVVSGTSFATAYVTGLLVKLKKTDQGTKCAKDELLLKLSTEITSVEKSSGLLQPTINIRKAIVFPLNKETDTLVRYKDMLNFEFKLYDERLKGKIGKSISGITVNNWRNIEWADDFDTIILGCTTELSELTKIDYKKAFIERAKEYKKQVYSFEELKEEINGYYPRVTRDMVPRKNRMKLYKPSIPVIAVMGTSSKQGKFSLQLELMRRFRRDCYDAGFIASEPSGYLFEADYVYHFGYHANLNIDVKDTISILNEMIWNTQLKEKEVVILGSQSNTINYVANNLVNFPVDQYVFMLGAQADVYILCVNPHDELDYIERTVNFINCISAGRVVALVMFPRGIRGNMRAFQYSISNYGDDELENAINRVSRRLGLPVYKLDDSESIDQLYENVIKELSE